MISKALSLAFGLVLCGTLAHTAFADAPKLRLVTEVATFAATTTENQCLDKVKAAISAQKLTVGDAPHAKTGTGPDLAVMVDCMQSWGSNTAHISATYLSTKPANVDAIVAAIKAALSAK